MEPLPVDEVIRVTGATVVRRGRHRDFQGISTDSRTVRRGELFVALRGERFDGHAFVRQALASGAAGVLVETDDARTESASHAHLRVSSCGDALLAIAGVHRSRLDATVVGITGSVGKSTTKEILSGLLSAAAPRAVVASEKSFNNRVGVPLTLFRAGRDTRFLVLEMGTSSPGEIETLAARARPSVGVVTRIAEAHLERLRDLAGVAQEKGALVRALPDSGTAVLEAGDPWAQKLAAETRARVLTFGISERTPASADVCALRVEPESGGMRFLLSVGGRIVGEGRSKLAGVHNVSNALAAIAAAIACGVPAEAALQTLASISLSLPMRLERREAAGIALVNDAYNANPASVESAIAWLKAESCTGLRILVLGEMAELGEEAAELHRRVGRLVAESGIDRFVTVGALAARASEAAAAGGMPFDRVDAVESASAIAPRLEPFLEPGDLVLVKGSRRAALERVVEELASRLGSRPALVLARER